MFPVRHIYIYLRPKNATIFPALRRYLRTPNSHNLGAVAHDNWPISSPNRRAPQRVAAAVAARSASHSTFRSKLSPSSVRSFPHRNCSPPTPQTHTSLPQPPIRLPLTLTHAQTRSKRTMTASASVTSPPTSPPAKRVKTSEAMASSETPSTTTPAVPQLDAAPPLLIKKLSPSAKLPTRGSAFSAGYDLYASQATSIPARGKALVETDISIAVPANTYGRIAPRSGLAAKHFIDTGAGVIDADYRGPVKVLLFNHAEADFAVAVGDRIAQLVIERIYTPDVVEVQELEESVRGAGGFGSTGTN